MTRVSKSRNGGISVLVRRAGLLRPIGFVALAFLLSGCELLFSPANGHLSNEPVLRSIATSARYRVDDDEFELRAADVEEDAITFYYRGVANRLDEAWVMRFSVKPSEQSPEALADPWSHLPLVRDLREGFHVVDEGKARQGEALVHWVAYEFTSSLRDDAGQPRRGVGVLATVAAESAESPVVWAAHIDNLGSRPAADLSTLAPLLEAMAP